MSYKNDVHDCLMALLSMNTSIDKVDQVISVVLSKLTKKKRYWRPPSAGVKARLIQGAQYF